MPSFEVLLAFFLATAVFAYIPGPAMLYAAAQTVARGRRAGLMAALGIHIGGYAHVFAAAMGLTVLFHAVPPLYAAVKLAGAGYLVWLGVQMIRRRNSASVEETRGAVSSPRAAFVQSIFVEVLNPKTAVFFLAFLPQFTDSAAGLPVAGQFLILGTVVNLMFSSADIVCVLLAGAILDRLRRSGGAQRIARYLGGGILIGLGAHIAVQRN
ncbi:Leucine efflux protein [Hartmannibacter diazotrophicus]|uniref:Leucine efflux protein n=1 Tax=Hartmannibacter diazotrophicus TaxID=1482074 RepID=A0A2C9D045_9HYPH|nr:LysE family translocator [Hartmannibacter diazotrophicus]SON53630.1 Leucine efflux protein [Hartmannibacter diazotrophicus]